MVTIVKELDLAISHKGMASGFWVGLIAEERRGKGWFF